MNKDYKYLELLYESIVENSNRLLDEEEQLADEIAEHIVQDLYKTLAPPNQFYGSEFLGVMIKSKLNKNFLNKTFPHTSEKVLDSICYVFNDCILHILYQYLVRIVGIKAPETVRFQSLENWWGGDRVIELKIPYSNKQEVLEMLKKTIKDAIVCVYKNGDPIQTRTSYHDWHEWRRDRLEFQDLHKKLPELKGIF
jgi:hypothetical protein